MRTERLGRVNREYGLLPEAGAISRYGTEEVHQRLSSLEVDEMAWQRGAMLRFGGNRPAEYLERLLWVCLSCGAVSTRASRNDKVVCTASAYRMVLNEYGFFVRDKGPLPFRDPAEWNAWQLPQFQAAAAAGHQAMIGAFAHSALRFRR